MKKEKKKKKKWYRSIYIFQKIRQGSRLLVQIYFQKNFSFVCNWILARRRIWGKRQWKRRKIFFMFKFLFSLVLRDYSKSYKISFPYTFPKVFLTSFYVSGFQTRKNGFPQNFYSFLSKIKLPNRALNSNLWIFIQQTKL